MRAPLAFQLASSAAGLPGRRNLSRASSQQPPTCRLSLNSTSSEPPCRILRQAGVRFGAWCGAGGAHGGTAAGMGPRVVPVVGSCRSLRPRQAQLNQQARTGTGCWPAPRLAPLPAAAPPPPAAGPGAAGCCRGPGLPALGPARTCCWPAGYGRQRGQWMGIWGWQGRAAAAIWQPCGMTCIPFTAWCASATPPPQQQQQQQQQHQQQAPQVCPSRQRTGTPAAGVPVSLDTD